MSFKNYIYRCFKFFLFLGCFLGLGVSCTDDSFDDRLEDGTAGGEGTTSLTLNVGLPQANSRAIGGYDDNPANYSTWEKAMDGRFFYRLTVFLIRNKRDDRKKNEIVRCVDYKYTDDKTVRQQITINDLQMGAYSIVAIANWSGLTADGKTYEGLASGTSAFHTNIQNLIDKSPKKATDPLLTITNDPDWKAMRDAKLANDDTGVCPQMPMPLTVVRGDIYLRPGGNQYNVELVRTFARLRIEVRNESPYHYVNFLSLSMGNITGDQTSLLVMDPRNWNPQNNLKSINVASANAMHPFQAVSIPGIYNSITDQTLTKANKGVLFDGYIMESRNTINPKDVYMYVLGFFESEGLYDFNKKYYSDLSNPVSDGGISDGRYLIKNVETGKFLVWEGNNIVARDLNLKDFTLQKGVNKFGDDAEKYFWTVGTSTFGWYDHKAISISNFTSQKVKFTTPDYNGETLETPKDYFHPHNETYESVKNALSLSAITYGKRKPKGYPYYFYYKCIDNKNELSDQKVSVRWYDNNNDAINNRKTPIGNANVLFQFFKVEDIIPSKQVTRTMPFEFINPDNENKAEQMTEIRRNDFVKIQLTVRYNSLTGQFEYEVADWDDKDGDISFH